MDNELTYGETIEQPFPKLEDIEWVMVEVPEWFFGDRANGLISNQKYNYEELSSWAITTTVYNEMEKVHKNSQDFKVTWQLKQTDPHAEIKAQYEEALKKYDVVKLFLDGRESYSFVYSVADEYEIKCYNIDWNKLLSWSYANGEFVECEFSDYDNLTTSIYYGRFTSYYNGKFGFDNNYYRYNYCKLQSKVTIKDEWLKEAK